MVLAAPLITYAHADQRLPDWRSRTTDVQAVNDSKADCQALLDAVLPFAKRMLTDHGTFYPYGGAMRPDGQLVSVGAYDGTEHPPPVEIARLLKKGFIDGAKKGEYKATALVADSRFTFAAGGEKTDAIAVSLNHRDNYSVTVIVPYKIDGGKLVLGTAVTQKGEGDVFPPR